MQEFGKSLWMSLVHMIKRQDKVCIRSFHNNETTLPQLFESKGVAETQQEHGIYLCQDQIS
jgi:hypothetical protein